MSWIWIEKQLTFKLRRHPSDLIFLVFGPKGKKIERDREREERREKREERREKREERREKREKNG